MDPSFQDLLKRLDHLSDQFGELREGVQKAIRIADEDPEMALTRARKVLELVIREVYERRCNEPAGTRPLENLIQRLVKDGHFPDRLDAYAATVRKLGNVGTHTFGEKITAQDVYQSLTQLMPILEWYFEVERPEALGRTPEPAAADRRRPGSGRLRRLPLAAAIAVVPKGLRSFDAQDADFFLDLLPGPRDKNGLPESIRFWKHRIEADGRPHLHGGSDLRTVSGCGKSSLVKAGLLPRLADQVLAGLRRGHRRRHRGPAAQGAAETLSGPAGRPGPDRHDGRPAPRAGRWARARRSSIVLDQFEQWLHAGKRRRGRRTGPGPPAVRRRAGPGGGPGAGRLLAGRDPLHGRPAHRACSRVRTPPLVDLFDPIHARNVLAAFGRAFGAARTGADEGAGIVPRSSRVRAWPRTAG